MNGVSLLPLDGVASEREIWVELLDGGDFEGNGAAPDGPVNKDWWNRRWVPVTSNGGGDHLCVDLDPAPGGTVGQMIDLATSQGQSRWSPLACAHSSPPTQMTWSLGGCGLTLKGTWSPRTTPNKQMQPTCGSPQLWMVNQPPHAADLCRSLAWVKRWPLQTFPLI